MRRKAKPAAPIDRRRKAAAGHCAQPRILTQTAADEGPLAIEDDGEKFGERLSGLECFSARDEAASKSALGAARLLLLAASLVVAYGVFSPAGRAPSLMPWDKAEHFTAFFGLMALALVSFPLTSLWRLAGLLSLAGALVELIQALPFVHRDCDWKDWAADTLGVLAVAGVVVAARARRSLAIQMRPPA
jgi:VanZ family protein